MKIEGLGRRADRAQTDPWNGKFRGIEQVDDVEFGSIIINVEFALPELLYLVAVCEDLKPLYLRGK